MRSRQGPNKRCLVYADMEPAIGRDSYLAMFSTTDERAKTTETEIDVLDLNVPAVWTCLVGITQPPPPLGWPQPVRKARPLRAKHHRTQQKKPHFDRAKVPTCVYVLLHVGSILAHFHQEWAGSGDGRWLFTTPMLAGAQIRPTLQFRWPFYRARLKQVHRRPCHQIAYADSQLFAARRRHRQSLANLNFFVVWKRLALLGVFVCSCLQ
ncbi:uncharacterized protein LOC100876315 [Anopheles sinensis]|uniref:Uncharacterized protein LOC100876315 n=1 Tax=Anopheles sinensis TaxID=74873 RepID=A0A084VRZ4_ANOSI|nr:uncharacterized protein LOC100876315 [Anopheles sinensis]